MSHLQVDYFFLVRQNIQLAMLLLLLPTRSLITYIKKFEVNLVPLYNRTKINLVEVNPLKPELNPICYLLALLGAHHFLHVSRIRVKLLTLR